MENVISVDLEDWYHLVHLRDYAKNKTPQIQYSIQPILKLFKKYNTTTTFFVLGEIAEKNPEVIELINKDGHEIASHGYSHKPLWEISKEEFIEELEKTKSIVTKISKEKILGYRAPYFSISKERSWAIESLKEMNYKYDSSIFPLKIGSWYGDSSAPLNPYNPLNSDILKNNHDENFKEFPLTVFDKNEIRFPLAGGIYLRTYPFLIFKTLLKQVKKQGRSLFLFFHPWETHKNLIKLDVPFKNKFIVYYGIKGMLKKIEHLLKTYKFSSFRENLD
ncbi:polysaccharide deacetylase [archaeon]|nr:polysaccharide deacetylase [archaeon]|tara:strand:+ start:5586 stop:6416 length:831 start_codon:yes stop_codon:yes gene_type:complete